MFDFGFSEILLTSAIALVVLGPERLPKVARQVGNWMGRARVMARQLTEQLEREVNADELLKQREKAAPTAAPVTTPPATTSYPAPLAPDGAQSRDSAATEALTSASSTSASPTLAPPAPAPEPPRTPHPNSPAMMHARDAVAVPSMPASPPSGTENSVKPANE
jgi:sec-independent protein translocase protein TatB